MQFLLIIQVVTTEGANSLLDFLLYRPANHYQLLQPDIINQLIKHACLILITIIGDSQVI